jgi:chromosome segregation ATPase
MKKWMLFIFPAAMFAIFLALYVAETHKWAEKDAAHKAEEAKVKQEKDAKEAVMRARAAEEAKKKADDRAEVARKKEEERLAKWNKEGQDVENETKRAQTAADEATKEINKMDAELTKLREAREKGNREFLDTMKRVQTAQIERRTSEMEIARLTEIINRRAIDDSQKKFTPAVVGKGTN